MSVGTSAGILNSEGPGAKENVVPLIKILFLLKDQLYTTMIGNSSLQNNKVHSIIKLIVY